MDAQAAVGVSSAKAYDSHLRGVWQSMKMNSAASGNVQTGMASSQGGVSGRPLAMSGGQISSGATIHNEPASVYQEQVTIASPIIQPAKLKSNQIASKKMIGMLGKVTNQVQRNVSGHGRKRVNYQSSAAKGNQAAYRVTTTSRDPPTRLIGPSAAPDGYQSYRETQNRLMATNQNQMLASLRGSAQQSFESIGQSAQTGQRTVR